MAGFRTVLAFALAVGGAAASFAAAPPARAPDSVEIERDKEALADAGLPVQPHALLEALRRAALAAAAPARLRLLVRDCSSDDRAVREDAERQLLLAGPVAAELLRTASVEGDAEQRRRARRCLHAFASGQRAELLRAAFRLIEPAGSPDAVPGLMDLLATEGDEEVKEEYLLALRRLCVGSPTDGHPVLLKALTDPAPGKRAATAFVLGRSVSPAARKEVRRLLADRAESVRLHAAWALLACGEKPAVAALVPLVEANDAAVASQARCLLRRLAFDTGTFGQLRARDAGKASAADWSAWWERAEGKADLASLGLATLFPRESFVYSDLDNGWVTFCTGDGTPRKRLEDVEGVVDVALLPAGRLLLCENHASRVTLRDFDGKVLWKVETPKPPVSAWPTADGGVCVVTDDKLAEYGKDGKARRKLALARGTSYAKAAAGGGFVLAMLDGELFHHDAEGKLQKKCTTEYSASLLWCSVTPLADGGHLVAARSVGVWEVSTKGETVSTWKLPGATSAARRGNGNLLISSATKRLVEIDRDGQVVWQRRTLGRPWHVQVIP